MNTGHEKPELIDSVKSLLMEKFSGEMNANFKVETYSVILNTEDRVESFVDLGLVDPNDSITII